jgi:hypothetical protein
LLADEEPVESLPGKYRLDALIRLKDDIGSEEWEHIEAWGEGG